MFNQSATKTVQPSTSGRFAPVMTLVIASKTEVGRGLDFGTCLIRVRQKPFSPQPVEDLRP